MSQKNRKLSKGTVERTQLFLRVNPLHPQTTIPCFRAHIGEVLFVHDISPAIKPRFQIAPGD